MRAPEFVAAKQSAHSQIRSLQQPQQQQQNDAMLEARLRDALRTAGNAVRRHGRVLAVRRT